MFSRQHPAVSKALAPAFYQRHPDFFKRFNIPGGKNALVQKAEQIGPRRLARLDRL